MNELTNQPGNSMEQGITEKLNFPYLGKKFPAS